MLRGVGWQSRMEHELGLKMPCSNPRCFTCHPGRRPVTGEIVARTFLEADQFAQAVEVTSFGDAEPMYLVGGYETEFPATPGEITRY